MFQKKRDDEQLAERIEDAYQNNRGVYGNPRIHAELKDFGMNCGRKRIVRLMQIVQISAMRKRRKAHKTESDEKDPFAPSLLEQNFAADTPNEK